MSFFSVGGKRPPLFLRRFFLFSLSLSFSLSRSLSHFCYRFVLSLSFSLYLSLSLKRQDVHIKDDVKIYSTSNNGGDFFPFPFYEGVTRSASPSVDASARRPDLPALASALRSAKAAYATTAPKAAAAAVCTV